MRTSQKDTDRDTLEVQSQLGENKTCCIYIAKYLSYFFTTTLSSLPANIILQITFIPAGRGPSTIEEAVELETEKEETELSIHH